MKFWKQSDIGLHTTFFIMMDAVYCTDKDSGRSGTSAEEPTDKGTRADRTSSAAERKNRQDRLVTWNIRRTAMYRISSFCPLHAISTPRTQRTNDT